MGDGKGYYGHERLELVERVDQDAAKVLDLGCGEGAMSAAIKRERNAQEIWGVEVVEAAPAALMKSIMRGSQTKRSA